MCFRYHNIGLISKKTAIRRQIFFQSVKFAPNNKLSRTFNGINEAVGFVITHIVLDRSFSLIKNESFSE